MALRKDNTAAAAAAPAFEEPANPAAAVATPELNPAPEVGAVAAPAEAANTSTAVAVPANSPTALVVGGKYTPALVQYQNAIDPHQMEFDTFRRITVGLDGFSDENEVELGKVIKIGLMSYNERYVCSPGKQDAESNELVRYSLDGVTIDDTGESCAEYVKALKETHGYTDASLKKYLTLLGFLIATEEKGELVDIPAEDREIVAVQVPPRSVSKFQRLQIEQGVKLAQGVVKPTDELVLRQQKVKGKTTTYAEILFGVK